jgi:hypothetical protein
LLGHVIGLRSVLLSNSKAPLEFRDAAIIVGAQLFDRCSQGFNFGVLCGRRTRNQYCKREKCAW